MRLYRPSLSTILSPEVDLDDPKTYEHLPKTIKECESKILECFGWALLYMNYIHEDIFRKYGDQKKRIEDFMNNYARNRKSNFENLLWYQEQLFLISDEIENMC